ncbi:hypothetical protein [Myceligenerans pegani]|uniref:Uncharacterized protein n=1 Tax=Myceligenerans pegani TaxID=2776917 RepID=A0ABR9MU90_9MICO|nr:hypothetical protein [Myceligenerans sp. TRM 65318]MBE1874936.1 hypothetical protein [Myceligenerans sp. TRM 65318]MBE3017207.1 hypothetical protein [Myceligenerans sp. TRM 65318]
MAKLTVIDWRALAALGLGIPYAALWLAEARATGTGLTDEVPRWVDWWSDAVQGVMRTGELTFPIWFVALVLLLGGAGLALEPAIRDPGERRYPVINLVVALGMFAAFAVAAWTVGADYYGFAA